MQMEAPLNQAIGRKLRELREARGIRKERIALELEMSAQNWALYEAGKQKLTVTMLPTIAGLYGMTVAELTAELFEEGLHERTPASITTSENTQTDLLIKSRLAPTWPRIHQPARSRELAAAGAR